MNNNASSATEHMKKKKKGRFSGKAKEILGPGKPIGLGDFLSGSKSNEAIRESINPANSKAGNSEILQPVNPETRTNPKATRIEALKPAREEFRCSEACGKKLHQYEPTDAATIDKVSAQSCYKVGVSSERQNNPNIAFTAFPNLVCEAMRERC